MKPRLYPENETNFESNGLGPLSDALACTVEENRNGAFELSMEYPVTGVLFDELKHGSIIFAPPNDSGEPQPFRVYGKSTPLSGVVTVRAKHISYQLSHIPVSPFTAGSCAAALQGLKTNAVEPCPFDFWTDKETVAAFTVTEPASARSLLGGVAGSVLDVYGGEYEFDRYTVKLHKARGTDSGVVIAYGKNLVDINQEESIENTITGVYPYYKDTDGNVLELPEKVISSESAQNFPYPRTVPLDCSQEWQETPSVEQLRAYAAAYVAREGIGVPAVSLKVSFVPLWQTEEYKAIAPAERLNLCDIATVRFEKLGVNARAKVVQTVYDVLAGRYESVTLGEASTDLADTIVAQDKAINAKADTNDLEAAAANASAWITGNKGGYVVLRRNADGQPYELLIMDKPTIEEATKVWRFNKSGLGYSSTGYNGTYGLAMTQDGQIVADYITTGTLSANLLRAGVLQDKTGKVFKLDLEAGTLDANFNSLQVSGKTQEQIAAEQAKEAAAAAEKAAKEAAAADLKEYQAAVEKTVQDLQGQIDGNITTWFYPYAPTAENKPASDWTTETEREAHAGDLFYNTDQASGKAYRWAIVGDIWQWLLLEDTDVAKALANAKTAQDTADGKRRTFISTPVPPYDVGDLWAKGAAGELMVCATARASGAFTSADWAPAADYVNTTGAAIAGRNLVSNSGLLGVESASIMTIADGVVTFTSDDATKYRSLTLPLTDIALENIAGKKLTVSCDVMISSAVQVASQDAAFVAARLWVTYTDDDVTYANAFYKTAGSAIAATLDFARFSATAEILNKPIKSASVGLVFQYATGSIKYRRPQVELGASATPWGPAPEDSAIAAGAPTLTQQEVFNKLTNNGQLQGLYMQDGKLYINAQYIATGRLSSADGVSYFDLAQGVANLKGEFSTEPYVNDTGAYRVYFSSGKIACQKKNTGSGWDDIGFIQWNYGVNPPESWIKGARIDATNSLDAGGVWITGAGQMLANNAGRRELIADMVNGHSVSWQWNGDMQKWVLAAD